MKAQFTRRGKVVQKKKHCPVCKSSRFRDLQNPQEEGEWLIIAKCQRCGYRFGVSARLQGKTQ